MADVSRKTLSMIVPRGTGRGGGMRNYFNRATSKTSVRITTGMISSMV